MAVKLRLMRMGKKKHPTYRVVAADSRSPRDGRFIELIGRYDPHPHPSVVEIDNERALHWLKVGAQPTAAVRKLLQISGAWGQFQVHRGEIHVVGEVAPPPERERKSKKARARAAAGEEEPAAAEETTAVEEAAPSDEPAAAEAGGEAEEASTAEEVVTEKEVAAAGEAPVATDEAPPVEDEATEAEEEN